MDLEDVELQTLFSDSCDYDITIFDDKHDSEKIIFYDDAFVKIHHGSINETKSDILVKYDGMQIIHDESWELRMLLSKIKEKRLTLYKDYAKNCLFNSLFCCEKTKDGIITSNVFSSCWQICASYFLADAICLLNTYRPNPTHMLDVMRKFKKNQINEHISTVTHTVGIERATPFLLDRILKSTIGFSDFVEKNNHSKIIQNKHELLVKNSMLSDCYFYLGYVNRDNFVRIKDTIDRQSDLIHILKVAFDIEADSNLLENHTKLIQKSCSTILTLLSSA
ncbi:hypothetical protein [Candidatus Nitrosarchaeum limnium]|uniref:Uncharacterized protein n=1 Tax=Candidatus Nitrosarchaeum limnium BG20 TaxID=859192 RepID=S2EJW4_9ARCH|nr:hypothetical protein [Candidatus Nitrosarchaeum limnium]EPA04977.1 hypothetical protein BG20_I0871 [Candidatus Nitrosarchaeum limnium BG20]